MSTIFLEVDDEITTAIARIREARDQHLALALPPGCRVATSRINFRILAREAASTGRSLAIIAPDVAVRSLAASADLPVFATVAEYEAAPVIEPAPVAASGKAAAGGSAAPEPSSGKGRKRGKEPKLLVVEPRSANARGKSGGGAPAGAAAASKGGSGGGSRRTRWIAFGVMIAIVALIFGVGAWIFLPGATVALTLRETDVQSVKFTVRADPAATAVDEANAVVPAREVSIQLSATGEYQATGTKVDEAPATGSVRWSNCDATQAYTIPSGTQVGTSGGVKFSTGAAVFLPVAILTGTPPNVKVQCSSRDVAVTAVKPGTDGNVNAGTITVIPSSLNSVVISVTNPAATTGGKHTEYQVVGQADIDKAVAELKAQMQTQLDAAVADPAQIPAGVRVVPGTKALGTISFNPDPATLKDQQITSFTVGASATGTVTGIDENVARQLAQKRLQANVDTGSQIVTSSITITLGDPKADGKAVTIPVEASAHQTRPITAEAVRALVRGKTIADAKTSLDPYGSSTISISPGWTSTIPTFDFRLSVEVVPASSKPAASPSPSGAAASAGASSLAASKAP